MEVRDDTRAASGQYCDPVGTYVLRELIKDIPLTENDDGTKAHITCVDAWNGNLYVGTSAGEVLHYVSIPSDPEDDTSQPSYIFATKLEPAYTTPQDGTDAGVKQMLLLPDPGKACILCNGTLTFYTLPELSPAFGGKIKQAGCLWVGGTDNNEVPNGGNAAHGTVIVICLKQRLRLIRIGEEARSIRNIELGGISAIQRRHDLACVADGRSYSLLDVVNQRKNELFPISSFSTPDIPPSEPELQLQPPRQREQSRSFSSTSPVRIPHAHERNVSLGAQPSSTDRLRPDNDSPWPARSSSRKAGSPAQPASREESPRKLDSGATSARTSSEFPRPAQPVALPANIVSPTPNEFLLTTGTKMSEPGVGMFVNLDGDVVRGTMEFTSYPESLALDGTDVSTSEQTGQQSDGEGYVLAMVNRRVDGSVTKAIEIQRWDADPGEAQNVKEWLNIAPSKVDIEDDIKEPGIGLRVATSPAEIATSDIGNTLRLRRVHSDSQLDEFNDAEVQRNNEENLFASRFSHATAKVIFYHEDKIYWVMRNALIVKLENQLRRAAARNEKGELIIDVPAVQRVINSIRGQEARNELEYLTLAYIRQKVSLLLFGSLILQTVKGIICYEHEKRRVEDALIAGEIDPRIILNLVPPFSNQVDEGPSGIWVPQGLRDTIYMIRQGFESEKISQDPKGAYGDNLLQPIKRYLFIWRKKKGFGSIADESQVFKTVDAALLHLLLMLDQKTARGPAAPGTVRLELNDVVDRGVDCFDRAVELFEQYHRLYMLSRLYQSRKMVAQVLTTWKRILEGEEDAGGELIEGEQDLRRYLTKLRDPRLVQEYGAWLANRNPKLGVQVFADESSRVRFQPSEAVDILKAKAPGAVKDYLEHLVFGKNQVQYVNDLIAFYLDTVLAELENSEEARTILLQSYATYRALRPPKPTYRQFIADNAIDAGWWHNRLRLLQLIGGSHGAASKYDVHTIGERLAPYSDELVPEMIILNGREGKHEEALRLLTHGLGDYDTAIRYCLLGGSSIFHPRPGFSPEQPLPSKDEQSRLFEYLLQEFFHITDLSERLERTAELLERFGSWFDVAKVLQQIPEEWSVELVSAFLVHAFRRLMQEKNETIVVKALSEAQNLRRAVEWIEKTENVPATIVHPTVEAG